MANNYNFNIKDDMRTLFGAGNGTKQTTNANTSTNTTYYSVPSASAVDYRLEAELAPIRAQMQVNQREYDLAKQRLEDNRDEAMRQAYVASQMQKRNLPQQLSAAGYNGGLTESTMAGMANQYLNNRNALEVQYADDLADLDFEKYKKDAELNAMIAQAQAEAQASRLSSSRGYRYTADTEEPAKPSGNNVRVSADEYARKLASYGMSSEYIANVLNNFGLK